MIKKPNRPFFGSGPTVKPLGWHPSILGQGLVSRSHRSPEGLIAIERVIDLTRQVLEIPNTHDIALVPGSASGAVQMAMWNLLGTRPVNVLASDIFGQRWLLDLQKNLSHIQRIEQCVPEGQIFDLAKISPDHDLLCVWNGSTSGTQFPDGDWISDDRQGLTICDATSAVYCTQLPWSKLDATAFSWQKGLGGEAGFGVLVLGPRALEHLDAHRATQNVPFILNLRRHGQALRDLFAAKPLNTISMMCLEEARWAHEWGLTQGGLKGLIKRSQKNLAILDAWVEKQDNLQFLCADPLWRSSSTVCIKRTHFENTWEPYHKIADTLKHQDVAYDFLNHGSATPCFRIWGGPSMEAEDLKALLPWIGP